jgi:hypothetical protein
MTRFEIVKEDADRSASAQASHAPARLTAERIPALCLGFSTGAAGAWPSVGMASPVARRK